ncbi:elongation of very long chain fatty acids protein AAEL008004-like [Ixodes scapularis]|uniref:elongation of very long chain fatty acids protein AAEL008004-like n=1 Tax=Ixodes scapularis TaxID=6945 RepID=UPI001A9F3A67|nr:elongation of very long chain fatty acids protein AAEL008004-like [Ixodes scapularis]
MALTAPGLLADLANKYDQFMSMRDPRTVGWGLTRDLKFILPISLGYLYIVKVWGPRWMAQRKPYKLKSVITAYNLFQVIVNGFFFVQYARHSYVGGGYNVLCQGVSYSRDSNSMVILNLSWWYIFVRIADFMDTFFFVATKKFSHITFLHVIHHFLVVLNGWLWLTLGSDGHIVMALCFNTMVHVIMYGYYFLSALGPRVRKYLWWKKYLTGLQIFQIVFLTLHMCIPLFYECGYPKILILLAVPQALMGLGLFINFYIQSYISRGRPDLCISQANKVE